MSVIYVCWRVLEMDNVRNSFTFVLSGSAHCLKLPIVEMNDELIARKLLADGDGTNEDRRLSYTLFTLFEQLDRAPTSTATVARIELQLQVRERKGYSRRVNRVFLLIPINALSE